jgi:hypothetical protein
VAEFEEKLNEILGNQEAMGQIMALARSLSGGGEGEAQREPPPADRTPRDPAPAMPSGMPDLAALVGGLDPGLLQIGMGLMQSCQGEDDRNAALLTALRPFLKEDRRAKLDRALQIARVTRLIRVALGSSGRKGEEGRV